MKTQFSLLFKFIIFILIHQSIQTSFAQDKYTGQWKGPFMDEFKAIINFSLKNGRYEGRIKLFSGENQIQDDPLTKIEINAHQCNFFIPDKDTYFSGNFNKAITELSGEFVFPDGSKHQLKVAKTDKNGSLTYSPKEIYITAKEKKYQVAELKEDLQFLFNQLITHHPQPYQYISKDLLDGLFNELITAFKTPLTLEEFFLSAAKLSTAVKCSHTGVRLPRTYQSLLEEYDRYFPLRLFFENGKAFYISGADDQHQMTPGDEIISINKILMKDIISQLFYFISSEGNNITTKYWELNQRFNLLYQLIDDNEDFQIRYINDKSNESIRVRSCPYAEIEKLKPLNEINEPVRFDYIENGKYGMVKISSFAIHDMDAYLLQLDSIFSELKTSKTRRLVIDLRDNPGGHPIFAAKLLSYLTKHDFTYFKRNKAVQEFLQLYEPMQANRLNFEGDIYVFVNGGCLSTTGHLISLLKYHTNAKFAGEEPGSTFYCCDYSTQLELPNSQIEFNVPRATFETAVKGFSFEKPFQVNFQINTTAKDVINKRDAFLELLNSE